MNDIQILNNDLADAINKITDAVKENQMLTDSIVQKLSQIEPVRQEEKKPEPEPPKEKVYFLPAKKNEQRVWINRIIDKLAIVQGGDTRMAVHTYKGWLLVYHCAALYVPGLLRICLFREQDKGEVMDTHHAAFLGVAGIL